MAVRHFDGASWITCAIGGLAEVPNGPHTMAALAKRTSGGAWSTVASLEDDTLDPKLGIQTNAIDQLVYVSGAGFTSTMQAWTPAEEWVLVAYTKPAGSATPRGHLYVYGTGLWSHADAPVAVGNGGTATLVRLGEMDGFGEMLIGRMAAVAVWDRVLSDAELEGLTGALADWLAAGPVALWPLTQTSTSEPVVDATSGGADQTSLVGTTVVTGDDPPGVDLSLGGGVREVTSHTRPVASVSGRSGVGSRTGGSHSGPVGSAATRAGAAARQTASTTGTSAATATRAGTSARVSTSWTAAVRAAAGRGGTGARTAESGTGRVSSTATRQARAVRTATSSTRQAVADAARRGTAGRAAASHTSPVASYATVSGAARRTATSTGRPAAAEAGRRGAAARNTVSWTGRVVSAATRVEVDILPGLHTPGFDRPQLIPGGLPRGI